MRERERARRAVQEINGLFYSAPAEASLASLTEIRFQRLTVQPLEHDERRPRLVRRNDRAHIERLHDARRRLRQLMEQSAFGQEILLEFIARRAHHGLRNTQTLHRHLLVEAEVM